MAKELPYFRFTVQEWQNGDISIEDYRLKGVFIDVCGFYWIRDCNVTEQMLSKRFSDASDEISALKSASIIKCFASGEISIKFLDEQWEELSKVKLKRVKAGRLGGVASAQARAKQKPSKCSSYKDKDKDKYSADSYEYRFSVYFYEQLVKPHGAKEPDFQKWSDIVRLMKERDGREEKYITDTLKAVLSYEGSGGFSWKDNIRSIDKFRLRMNEGKINPNINGNNLRKDSQHIESVFAPNDQG